MDRSDKFKDWGIAILRVAIGSIFVAHGAQKLFMFGITGVAGFMEQAGLPFPLLSDLARLQIAGRNIIQEVRRRRGPAWAVC